MKKFDRKIILILCMFVLKPAASPQPLVAGPQPANQQSNQILNMQEGSHFAGLSTSPESMARTANNRPVAETGGNPDPSPYATRVFEYKPAPGQFINKAPFGLPGNADNVLGAPDGSVISLGGFGGSITVGFDQPIRNDPQNPYGVDFTVGGNAFPNWTEPGAVMVMKDENGNGLPDDTWYELAGSDYHFSSSKKVDITYFNPGYTVAHDVLWETGEGEAGVIFKNNFHRQPYYPQPVIFNNVNNLEEKYTGTAVKIRVNRSNPGFVTSGSLSFGYADNKSGNSTPTIPGNPYFDDENGRSADGFDLSWAVNEQGNPVVLDEVHFVKVYNAAQENAGWLGEASTEIEGFAITTPDPDWVQRDYLFQLIGSAPFQLLKGETHSFEGILFKNGIPQDALASWSVSDESLGNIDRNGNFSALEKGQVTISFSANADLEPATFTLEIVELTDMVLSTNKTELYINERMYLNTESIDSRPSPSNRFVYDRYSFSVDNEELAEVSPSGIVTARSAGVVTVTATSQTDATISKSIQLTVSEAPAIVLTGNDHLHYAQGAATAMINLDTVFSVEEPGQIINKVVKNSNDFLVQPEIDNAGVLHLTFTEAAAGMSAVTIASTAYGSTREFDLTVQVDPLRTTIKPKQVVFVNGGQFGFQKGNVQVYDPAQGVTVKLADFARAESVQDMATDGRYAYVSAEYDIIKYDLVTASEAAIRRTQDISDKTADGQGSDGAGVNHSMALYEDWLLATRQNSSAPPEDGYNVRIYNKADLSLVTKIPVSTQASDVIVVGDSAFVALNGGFAGTSGQLAIIDLISLELKEEYDFGSDGTGIMQMFHQNGVLYILAQEKLLKYNIAGRTHQLHNIAIGHADFSSSPLATAIVNNTLYGKVNWGTSFPVNKGFGTVDLGSLTISANDIIGMNTDPEIRDNGYTLMASAYDHEDALFYFTFGSWSGPGIGRIYNKNGTLAGSFTGVEASPERMAVSYAVVNQSPFLQKSLDAITLYEHETVDLSFDDYFQDIDDETLNYTLTMEEGEALPEWISFTGGRFTATAESHLRAMTLSLQVKAEDAYLESVSKQFQLKIIPVDDAPVVANPLADKVVNENAEELRISLENVFDDEDSENADMQFSITENSNAALVQTTIETKALILSFTPDLYGETIIGVTCTSDGKTVNASFLLTVNKVDAAPFVVSPIADMEIEENAPDQSIALAGVFDDEDDELADMTYSVLDNSNEQLVTATVSGDLLLLSFAKDLLGEADVTVQATSGSKSVTETFKITVREHMVTGLDTDFATLNIYPNPVMTDLHITTGSSGPLSIRIVKADGTTLYKHDAPVNHVTVDVSALAAGMYMLELNNGNRRITKRIIKN